MKIGTAPDIYSHKGQPLSLSSVGVGISALFFLIMFWGVLGALWWWSPTRRGALALSLGVGGQ